eukprot:14385364-Alexandrium_andersonii.AAC.1
MRLAALTASQQTAGCPVACWPGPRPAQGTAALWCPCRVHARHGLRAGHSCGPRLCQRSDT